jgi:predicted nucleic acid-binding protein
VTVFVLDASVAVKWFLSPKDEPLSAEALALYQEYMQGNLNFIVPDIFWAEVGSAFWKAIRLGRFQKALALEAIASLAKCELPTFSVAALLERAFLIATTFDRSVYDALYVALAVQSGAEVITADERLANALAARFPVKWLGAIQ